VSKTIHIPFGPLYSITQLTDPNYQQGSNPNDPNRNYIKIAKRRLYSYLEQKREFGYII